MKQTQVRFNLKGLDEFRKAMGGTYRTRVGVLGDKAARNDSDGKLNNAEIGAIQMFGSFANNIPPRDFLLMPIQSKQRELIKAMGSSVVKAAMDQQDYKRVFELLGIKAEELVQMAFETGGFGQWAPNKPATVAAKGSAAPLIDTSQLRRAIASDVVKKSGGAIATGTV